MIIEVTSTQHKECIEITHQVRELVADSGVQRGLCHIMVLHATAAVVVNENDDPNIGVDLIAALDRAIPDHDGWLHDRVDNNAQAHIKSAILGPSETVQIRDVRAHGDRITDEEPGHWALTNHCRRRQIFSSAQPTASQ